MAKFMDVHDGFLGVTEAQLQEALERDQAMTGPTKEAVMRIHERAGHPTAEVHAFSLEVV